MFTPVKPHKGRPILSERDRLWNAQQGLCFYCEQPMQLPKGANKKGVRFPDDGATIEHLERLADGGPNIFWNKRLACASCNHERQEVPWQDWKLQRAPRRAPYVQRLFPMTANPLADINNICFVDTETRTERGVDGPEGNLKTAGTYRYAQHAFVIISTWAVGDEPVWDWSLHSGFDGDYLCWGDAPYKLKEFWKRAEQREAWFAAFNAGFDRTLINAGTYGFPVIETDMMIDVMAQAVASNLPPNLEGSSRAITGRGKQDDGKFLINLFCGPNGPQPHERPEEWARFVSYALRDTSEMRDVWKATRPLPFAEWEDYWVSEAINNRGMRVDTEFARRAAAVADAEAKRLAGELTRWTNGQITAVTQVARIASWLYDRLPYAEAREILVKEWDEDKEAGEDGEGDQVVGKLGMDKGRIEGLVAFFETRRKENGGTLSDSDQLMFDVIQARQFGGSTTPFKFEKIALQQVDDRICGQYVFNGAQQTGRFSSKGVQIHNLTRSALKGHEEEAIEFINNIEV